MINFKQSLCVAAIAFASPVFAGDPCPVGITIHDLGTPDWLVRDDILANLQTQSTKMGYRFVEHELGEEVTYIQPSSPAEIAGMRVGDILTAINGEPPRRAWEKLSSGQVVSLSIKRGEEEIELQATIGVADPVAFGMVKAWAKQDCGSAGYNRVLGAKRDQTLALMFDENRAFECEKADQNLLKLGDKYEQSGDVYFIRGSRRVMISMPDWGTACIASRSLDGDQYSDEALLTFLNKAISGYVQDRHNNP